MTENKGFLRSDMFYIEHLDPDSSEDIQAIDSFTVDAPEGQGLSAYLKEYSCAEELDRSMRTYLVRDIITDECVGYFALKAGLISLNEIEVEVEDTETGEHTTVKEFDTLPGVELANFAVNSSCISAYPYLKGVGHVIFTEFIIPMIEQAAQYVGVKMVYIYALPYDKLISRYQRYGFSRLPETEENDLHRRLKPRYDESCKFMYLLLN